MKENNKIISGTFPDNIASTMQYGNNLEALAVSLNTIGMVSIKRTHEILRALFGVPISTGTIHSMVMGLAGKLTDTVEHIRQAVVSSTVNHFDETGSRVDKKTMWFHNASNEYYTYLTVSEKRGKEGMDAAGVLPEFKGIALHDCWMPYWRYGGIQHALCCAHLLRELTGVIENQPKQTWPQEMIDLLLIQEKKPGKRGRQAKGKVRALIERLSEYKDAVCLFTKNFFVPFDNNQAERDVRMIKVKTKVSGCFRTKEGADAFAKIMSYIGTSNKHGINSFIAVKKALMNKSNFVFG
jgi:transposase